MKKYLVIFLSLLLVLLSYFYFGAKNTYLEGQIFYCNKKPVLDKNIFVGIFKDLESIKSFKPLKSIVLKNSNHYKLKTNSLNVNNFFLIVYTTNYDVSMPPLKDSLINDWEISIDSANYYKNISLCSQGLDSLERIKFVFKNKNLNETAVEESVEEPREDDINTEDVGTELYHYKINASLDSNFFKNICAENDKLIAIVEVYNSKINDFFPTKKNKYSLKTKSPLDSIILYCNEFNFEFNFTSYAEEIYPYVTARVVDQVSKKIVYTGVAEDINGVPISMLSNRKENTPLTILLKKNSKPDFGSLIINVGKEALIAEIRNIGFLKTKFNLEQAYLSDENGQILINMLPLNSLIPFSIIDPQTGNILNFDVYMEFPIQNIKLPPLKFSKISLTVIHNHEFSSISTLSNEPKNKIQLKLNNNFEQIFDLEANKTIYFTLNDKNYNTALLDLLIENNLIIEPSNIYLKEIKGTVFKTSASGINSPCVACVLDLLYSSETANTAENGSFFMELKNMFLEPSLYLSINNSFIVNTLIPKGFNVLESKIYIPSKDLLRLFNSVSATRKNNSLIFGLSKGKVFLSNASSIKEAKYLTDKNIFFIPDLDTGIYTLFVIENNLISHIRKVNIINKNSVIIIN